MSRFSKATAMKSAPIYEIGARDVVALEHPMIVKNLDNGLKTFGRGPVFTRILDSENIEACVPLYLRHNNPMSVPILSRNNATDNILLKITVPKRTGRKRKRGSQETFSGTVPIDLDTTSDNIQSHSRRDDPAVLLRALKDNVDKYEVEVVAAIEQTHRFRGVADFHASTTDPSGMASKVGALVSAGHLDAVRQFQFEPGVNWEKNGEILPPPNYTTNALPVNWAWHQNIGLEEVSPEPTVKPELTGPALVQKTELGKTQRDRFSGLDLEIPTKNPHEVPDNANLRSLILAVEEALVERPVWTIRALKNRLAGHPHLVRFKQALRYTSYTLGSGPFRDLVIKYGVDPRTDRKYYKYQVMAFNNVDFDDFGSGIVDNAPQSESENLNSHVFDGKRLDLDKKLWQLCDVTEPFLAKLIDSVAFREQFELVHDGWICNGSWVKIRASMRVKILGLIFNVDVPTAKFDAALNQMPDIVDDNSKHANELNFNYRIFAFTEDELEERRSRGEMEFPVGCMFRPKSYRHKDRIKVKNPDALWTRVNSKQKASKEGTQPASSEVAQQATAPTAEGGLRTSVEMEDPFVDSQPTTPGNSSFSLKPPPMRQSTDAEEDSDMAEYERILARQFGDASDDQNGSDNEEDEEESGHEEDDNEDDDDDDGGEDAESDAPDEPAV